ncbi:hypothetical protein GQ53DRAFT_730996 [Thozetella sp. PMI_491]|nr:hypothetical protein GQ53DRAFT_730996 [Thozetella sp. PMI_491]
MRAFGPCSIALVLASALALPSALAIQSSKPIVLDRSGGFAIGGRVMTNPNNTKQSLSCDHGYVEYFIPWTPRETSLVMWHSSSTQVWQNRWDGGEGFKDMFLRRDYPVYLWDGPRVGRANWGCAAQTYRPGYRDQGNFFAWNFGNGYPKWWPDVQFPTNSTSAWDQAVRARYEEFDTAENAQLQTDAAAVAADSGKLGNQIVYLTNSAGGMRALMTAVKSNSTNIKGIVAYECIGSVFPDNYTSSQPGFPAGGFGPFLFPVEAYKKLARLTSIQFVWGDHRDETWSSLADSRKMAEIINSYGGNAEVVSLSHDYGLHGNTHIAFADMNNQDIGAILESYLANNKLDRYA